MSFDGHCTIEDDLEVRGVRVPCIVTSDAICFASLTAGLGLIALYGFHVSDHLFKVDPMAYLYSTDLAVLAAPSALRMGLSLTTSILVHWLDRGHCSGIGSRGYGYL